LSVVSAGILAALATTPRATAARPSPRTRVSPRHFRRAPRHRGTDRAPATFLPRDSL